MQVPLPLGFKWLTSIWKSFVRWSNVTIYERGKLEIRRLDILLLILGASIAIYYAVFYGWQTAVLGVLMYILVIFVSVWML